MALQFPANPIVGQPSGTYEYTDPQGNVIVYTWDGEKWISSSSGAGVIPDIDEDAQQPGTLDGRYVNIPGDHMTGALIIGPNASTDNIILNADGLAQAGGIEFIKNWQSGKVSSRGIVYSGGRAALLSTNHPNANDENVDVFLARVDPTTFDADGNKSPINVDTAVSFKAESPLGNDKGEYGKFKSYVGFKATDQGDGTTNAIWDGTKDSYGFLSGVTNRPHAAGGQTYGFYAEGDAPNYFGGPIQIVSSNVTNGRYSPRIHFNKEGAETGTDTGIFGTGNGQVRIVGGDGSVSDGHRDLMTLDQKGFRFRTEKATETCYVIDGTIEQATGGGNANGIIVKPDVAVAVSMFRGINSSGTLTADVKVDNYAFYDASPIASNVNAGSTIGNVYAYHASGATNANNLKAEKSYSFYTDLTANADKQYAFYSAGSAPNYFKGNIDCDGLINGTFSLRMQTDDPAAFQTTYTTDEEGNQVEQQTYVGTTEDLLSIIKDLRARVAALEAAA